MWLYSLEKESVKQLSWKDGPGERNTEAENDNTMATTDSKMNYLITSNKVNQLLMISAFSDYHAWGV